MRIFLVVLLLIFSLQSWTNADDISEFEIEGISIGDSLLEYYSEEIILKQKKNGFIYPNKEFFTARMVNTHGNVYNDLQFQIKANDLDYKIYSIEGIILYDNDIDNCKIEQNKISLVIDELFPDSEKFNDNGKIRADPNNMSMGYEIYYMLKSGGNIVIACYDWSEELTTSRGWVDNLKVIIDSKEFHVWLNNKAYN